MYVNGSTQKYDKVFYPIIGKSGRLANQIWQIASTIGIAHKLGLPPQFHKWEYQRYFSVDPSFFVKSLSKDGYNVTEYPTYMAPADRFCLQDYSLFSDIEDQIRSYFLPSELSKSQLDAEYGWVYELENKCCIHIRRDERVFREVLHDTHPMPSLQYYYDAIDYLGGRKAYNYIVFSDDIAWCREAFKNEEFYFVDGYPRYEKTYGDGDEPPIRDHLDLLLMTDCVRHIIPNSTYSWWGAFLANKEAPIYPDPWYGPALSHVDASLQFPDHWIKLGW